MSDTKRYSRREFLTITSAAAAGLWAYSAFGVNPMKRGKKPNLLFLWTDQQRADTLAVYGNRKIKVPTLNALSRESYVFLRPYVIQPVSTPNRGSVMTGLYPHQHGATANNNPLYADARCFPELLADPDYRTGYFGKWHLGDEIFAQHGFEEFDSVEDNYISHYSPGRDKAARSGYHHFLLSHGYQPDSSKNVFSRGFVTKLPYEHSKPRWLEIQATQFLERHKDSPFVLYVNYLEPHSPFAGPHNDMHDPASLDMDETLGRRLTDDDPMRYHLRRLELSEEKWRERNRNYAGLCHSVDRSVDGILRKLDELGLRDDTIVVFTSDHGEMMGAHELQHKSVQYEQAIKIPLMIRVPWLSRTQVLVEQPVSQIDLVPTLLQLMGKSLRDYAFLPGQSLLPMMGGERRKDNYVISLWNQNKGSDEKYDAFTQENRKYGKAAFRTIIADDGWKLTLSDIDKNQLFNLTTDPQEMDNLYYTGKHADVIDELASKIGQWQQRVGDTLVLKR